MIISVNLSKEKILKTLNEVYKIKNFHSILFCSSFLTIKYLRFFCCCFFFSITLNKKRYINSLLKKNLGDYFFMNRTLEKTFFRNHILYLLGFQNILRKTSQFDDSLW